MPRTDGTEETTDNDAEETKEKKSRKRTREEWVKRSRM